METQEPAAVRSSFKDKLTSRREIESRDDLDECISNDDEEEGLEDWMDEDCLTISLKG